MPPNAALPMRRAPPAPEMDSKSVPRLKPGVRLRAADAEAVLLVPEGIVRLSPTAAEIVSAIDGLRSVGEIAALMSERFDTRENDASEDVVQLLRRFADHAWIALEP